MKPWQASSRARDVTGRLRSDEDQKAGSKTGNWLIDLKTLAHHLATTPEAIRMLASKEQHLKWSFTTDQGWCIHKRDLTAWKFASRNAGRSE